MNAASHSGTPGTIVEQTGAICYRPAGHGAFEVLLVSSRRNGLWGIPKGHIEQGETTWQAAEREAFEEGGVRGTISRTPVGSFTYLKDSDDPTYRVHAHLLAVEHRQSAYPEQTCRKIAWQPLTAAIEGVVRPELRTILRSAMDLLTAS